MHYQVIQYQGYVLPAPQPISVYQGKHPSNHFAALFLRLVNSCKDHANVYVSLFSQLQLQKTGQWGQWSRNKPMAKFATAMTMQTVDEFSGLMFTEKCLRDSYYTKASGPTDIKYEEAMVIVQNIALQIDMIEPNLSTYAYLKRTNRTVHHRASYKPQQNRFTLRKKLYEEYKNAEPMLIEQNDSTMPSPSHSDVYKMEANISDVLTQKFMELKEDKADKLDTKESYLSKVQRLALQSGFWTEDSNLAVVNGDIHMLRPDDEHTNTAMLNLSLSLQFGEYIISMPYDGHCAFHMFSLASKETNIKTLLNQRFSTKNFSKTVKCFQDIKKYMPTGMTARQICMFTSFTVLQADTVDTFTDSDSNFIGVSGHCHVRTGIQIGQKITTQKLELKQEYGTFNLNYKMGESYMNFSYRETMHPITLLNSNNIVYQSKSDIDWYNYTIDKLYTLGYKQSNQKPQVQEKGMISNYYKRLEFISNQCGLYADKCGSVLLLGEAPGSFAQWLSMQKGFNTILAISEKSSIPSYTFDKLLDSQPLIKYEYADLTQDTIVQQGKYRTIIIDANQKFEYTYETENQMELVGRILDIQVKQLPEILIVKRYFELDSHSTDIAWFLENYKHVSILRSDDIHFTLPDYYLYCRTPVASTNKSCPGSLIKLFKQYLKTAFFTQTSNSMCFDLQGTNTGKTQSDYQQQLDKIIITEAQASLFNPVENHPIKEEEEEDWIENEEQDQSLFQQLQHKIRQDCFELQIQDEEDVIFMYFQELNTDDDIVYKQHLNNSSIYVTQFNSAIKTVNESYSQSYPYLPVVKHEKSITGKEDLQFARITQQENQEYQSPQVTQQINRIPQLDNIIEQETKATMNIMPVSNEKLIAKLQDEISYKVENAIHPKDRLYSNDVLMHFYEIADNEIKTLEKLLVDDKFFKLAFQHGIVEAGKLNGRTIRQINEIDTKVTQVVPETVNVRKTDENFTIGKYESAKKALIGLAKTTKGTKDFVSKTLEQADKHKIIENISHNTSRRTSFVTFKPFAPTATLDNTKLNTETTSRNTEPLVQVSHVTWYKADKQKNLKNRPVPYSYKQIEDQLNYLQKFSYIRHEIQYSTFVSTAYGDHCLILAIAYSLFKDGAKHLQYVAPYFNTLPQYDIKNDQWTYVINGKITNKITTEEENQLVMEQSVQNFLLRNYYNVKAEGPLPQDTLKDLSIAYDFQIAEKEGQYGVYTVESGKNLLHAMVKFKPIRMGKQVQYLDRNTGQQMEEIFYTNIQNMYEGRLDCNITEHDICVYYSYLKRTVHFYRDNQQWPYETNCSNQTKPQYCYKLIENNLLLTNYPKPIDYEPRLSNNITEVEQVYQVKRQEGKANRFFYIEKEIVHVDTTTRLSIRKQKYVADNYGSDVGENSFHYGSVDLPHPNLRWETDRLTIHAIKELFHGDIIEIAGKWHKTGSMLRKSNYKGRYTVYRSPDLHQCDIDYYKKYNRKATECMPYPVNIIPGSVDIMTDSEPNQSILAIDCIYYPGVQEYIERYLSQNQKEVAYIVYNQSPKIAGVYNYHNKEGNCKVYEVGGKMWLDNCPKGNSQIYRHEVLDYEQTAYEWQRGSLHFSVLQSVAIGIGLYQKLVRVKYIEEKLDITPKLTQHIPEGLVDMLHTLIFPKTVNIASDIDPIVYDRVQNWVTNPINNAMLKTDPDNALLMATNYTSIYVNESLDAGIVSDCIVAIDHNIRETKLRHSEAMHTIPATMRNYMYKTLSYIRNHRWMVYLLRPFQKYIGANETSSYRMFYAYATVIFCFIQFVRLTLFYYCLMFLKKYKTVQFIFMCIPVLDFAINFYANPTISIYDHFDTTLENCVNKLIIPHIISVIVDSLLMLAYWLLISFIALLSLRLLAGCYELFGDFLYLQSMKESVTAKLDKLLNHLFVLCYQTDRFFGGKTMISQDDLSYQHLQNKQPFVQFEKHKMEELETTDPIDSQAINKVEYNRQVNYHQTLKNLAIQPVLMKPVVTCSRYEDNFANLFAPKSTVQHPLNGLWAMVIRQAGVKLTPSKSYIQNLRSLVPGYQQADYERAIMMKSKQFVNMQQYALMQVKRKRSIYLKGIAKWEKTKKISVFQSANQKFFEKNHQIDIAKLRNTGKYIKARNVMDQSAEAKVVLGHWGHNIIIANKFLDTEKARYEGDIRYMYPRFAPGMKPEDLNLTINQQLKTFKDPVIVYTDGSNFDSHQHALLLETFDVVQLKAARCILAEFNFTWDEVKEIVTKACKLDSKVGLNLPMTYDGMRTYAGLIIFHLIGTVFSGHPLRTTLGNTQRMLDIHRALAMKYNYNTTYENIQASDDGIHIIERIDLPKLQEAFKEAYASMGSVGVHGIGMVLKELVVYEKGFSFLSKSACKDMNGDYVLKRFCNRLVATGNQSFKSITKLELDQAVKDQMKAYLHEADPMTSFFKDKFPQHNIKINKYAYDQIDEEQKYKQHDVHEYVIRIDPEQEYQENFFVNAGGLWPAYGNKLIGGKTTPEQNKTIQEIEKQQQQNINIMPPKPENNQEFNDKPKKKYQPRRRQDYINNNTIQSISKQISNLQKQFNTKGKSYDTVDKLYRTDSKFKDRVDYFDRYNTKQLSQQAMKSLLADAKEQQGYQRMNLLERKHFLQILALDDWQSVITAAIPLIQKYGGDVVNWISDQWKPKTSQTVDMNLIEEQKQNPVVTGPLSVQLYRPTQPYVNQGTLSYSDGSYDYDAVYTEAIKAWLNCARYLAKVPLLQSIKTAQFANTFETNLLTDSSGNVGFYFFPNNVAGVGNNAVSNSVWNQYFQTSAGFNPTTGAYTTINGAAGIFNTTTSVSQFIVDFARIQILPITSMTTNQGKLEMIYFQVAPNSSVGGSVQPIIPGSTLPLNPFYQLANLNTSIYGSRIPSDSDQTFKTVTGTSGFYQDGTSSTSEGFYVAITGGAPSTQIATVRMSLCGQFIPVTAAIGLSPMAYTHPGIATVQAISNLVLKTPRLQSLSDSEAETMIDMLPSNSVIKFNDVMKALGQGVVKLQQRPSYIPTSNPESGMQEISFEKFS